MEELHDREYKALRATIRERGTVRVITFFVTLCVWGALELAVLAHPHHVIAPLVPLMVLVAGFETVFQLHLGVERVGRYLQAAYEQSPGWETAAMAYGKAYPSAGSDPLFARIFLLATLIGILPSVSFIGAPVVYFIAGVPLTGGTSIVLAFAALILAHVAFGARIVMARRRAGRQRAEDLARFRDLLSPK